MKKFLTTISIDNLIHCVILVSVDEAKISDRKIKFKKLRTGAGKKNSQESWTRLKIEKNSHYTIFGKAVVTMLAQNGAEPTFKPTLDFPGNFQRNFFQN